MKAKTKPYESPVDKIIAARARGRAQIAEIRARKAAQTTKANMRKFPPVELTKFFKP